jgi:hypothetical protein
MLLAILDKPQRSIFVTNELTNRLNVSYPEGPTGAVG